MATNEHDADTPNAPDHVPAFWPNTPFQTAANFTPPEGVRGHEDYYEITELDTSPMPAPEWEYVWFLSDGSTWRTRYRDA